MRINDACFAKRQRKLRAQALLRFTRSRCLEWTLRMTYPWVMTSRMARGTRDPQMARFMQLLDDADYNVERMVDSK